MTHRALGTDNTFDKRLKLRVLVRVFGPFTIFFNMLAAVSKGYRLHFINLCQTVIYTSISILYLVEKGCPNVHLATNPYCNDASNVEECLWDMGNCCGTQVIYKCFYCDCHFPISKVMNGTTFQKFGGMSVDFNNYLTALAELREVM